MIKIALNIKQGQYKQTLDTVNKTMEKIHEEGNAGGRGGGVRDRREEGKPE